MALRLSIASLLTLAFALASPLEQQNILQAQAQAPAPRPKHVPSPHFDAAPNSVGLLLTTPSSEREVTHVWLPLGQRVETRSSLPALPFPSLLHS